VARDRVHLMRTRYNVPRDGMVNRAIYWLVRVWASWSDTMHGVIRCMAWHTEMWAIYAVIHTGICAQYVMGHTDHVGNTWDTLWPCWQYVVIHSDHMGTVRCDMLRIWTAQIDATYHDALWPPGQYILKTYWPCRPHRLIHHIVRHSDHVGIMWDTLWPHGQYILKHTDHVDRIDWCIIMWDTLTTCALCGIHSDHVGNMKWYMLRIWTAQIDATYHDTLWPHGHYVGYTLTTWALCGETYWDVDSIDWHILTTWAIWHDTYRPCRQHRMMRHIMIHSDHMGNIYWNILIMQTA
jgi:hypothetical protein